MDTCIPNDAYTRLIEALATAKSCNEQAIVDILMAARIWPVSVKSLAKIVPLSLVRDAA